MKVGVSGAGGRLGGAVITRLRELPGAHTVVGISRSPDKVQHANEVRFGDYDAPDSLSLAYAGLDRVLIIPTLDVGYGARARQLIAAIDAAQFAGVDQVILISDAGTREEAEPAVGAASWAGEQHLMRTSRSWAILRANYFMESFAQEIALWQSIGHLAELSENRVGFVSRDDVAAAAAGMLVGDGHSGAFYNATGPEVISVKDRASLISRLGGEAIEGVQVTVEQLRIQLKAVGYPEAFLAIALETKLKCSSGLFDMLTGDVERLSGRRPVSLESVLAKVIVRPTPPCDRQETT